MGIDIHGFIEVRPWASWPDLPSEVPWEAAARLDCLNITRDYDAFGCLFGVMNFAGFLSNSGLQPALRLSRASMRRAWKSPQLEHELISRYVPCDGSQTSRS